jgi:hypothetical protein
MKPATIRAGIAFLAMGALILMIPWTEMQTIGQPMPPMLKNAATAPISATHCIGCHGDSKSKAYANYKRLGITDFIKLDEHETWSSQDLHSQAFNNIIPRPPGMGDPGNLAWRMEQVLKTDPKRGSQYKVAEQAECLACHSMDLKPKAVDRKSARVDFDLGRFNTKAGVSCETCHGLADVKWLSKHIQDSWRRESPKVKFEEYHQVDLRSPRARAEKCASCHIGDKDEGKFVTHEMYAAGHPPLPAFEMAAYGADQPAHYHPPRENKGLKKLAEENAAQARKNFHFDQDEFTGARDIAIGCVAAFRANMKLLANEANTVSSTGLLDFAHFDCAACHHDLKNPSDRQNRTGGVPGRPLMKMPVELLNAVLDHTAATMLDSETSKLRTRFSDELESLRKAFGAKAFGDAAAIKDRASALVIICDDILKKMDSITYTKSIAQALSKKLSERVTELGKIENGKLQQYLDYDAAQQLTWAALTLRKELGEVDADAASKRLEEVIQLRLRVPEANTDGKPDPIEMGLGKRLKKQYDKYDSEKYFKAMNDLLNSGGQKK